MNKVKQILIEAKERISTPERWTKGAMFRDAKGEPCYLPACSGSACMLGSFVPHVGPYRLRSVDHAQSVLRHAAELFSGDHYITIARFNDHPATRHQEVMAVFDKAIAMADQDDACSVTE